MIWFPRPSVRSAWDAFAGERSALAGARTCEMSPQFYWRIGSRMRNLPTMSTINNRELLCPIRPPSAAIAACAGLHVEFRIPPQNRTTRVPVAKRRLQEANSRDSVTIIVNCVLPRWPDAIHDRNDSSRMETAPQSQLNRSFSTPDES